MALEWRPVLLCARTSYCEPVGVLETRLLVYSRRSSYLEFNNIACECNWTEGDLLIYLSEKVSTYGTDKIGISLVAFLTLLDIR